MLKKCKKFEKWVELRVVWREMEKMPRKKLKTSIIISCDVRMLWKSLGRLLGDLRSELALKTVKFTM
jgi:hypothetical protein